MTFEWWYHSWWTCTTDPNGKRENNLSNWLCNVDHNRKFASKYKNNKAINGIRCGHRTDCQNTSILLLIWNGWLILTAKGTLSILSKYLCSALSLSLSIYPLYICQFRLENHKTESLTRFRLTLSNDMIWYYYFFLFCSLASL